ncbi:hypothetical protein CLOM_g3893 [Closterium sp. NIES-68]|nr:hypothetical protein CLOM_g3893 [Closterium sp. NIES-68]GJP66819.1 hypothetical protein CLOP_g23715 [Closterium sp. NIES-67]
MASASTAGAISAPPLSSLHSTPLSHSLGRSALHFAPLGQSHCARTHRRSRRTAPSAAHHSHNRASRIDESAQKWGGVLRLEDGKTGGAGEYSAWSPVKVPPRAVPRPPRAQPTKAQRQRSAKARASSGSAAVLRGEPTAIAVAVPVPDGLSIGLGDSIREPTAGAPRSAAIGAKSMAQALEISPVTAGAMVAAIGASALAAPFFLGFLSPDAPLQTNVLAYMTAMIGFYMAWNIGANDVSNAMGTSVGSGALSMRTAVLVAGVLEFGGAMLVGSHVSDTMQTGIIDPGVFVNDQPLLFTGMVSSLAAAGTWLQIATHFGWPVSTTHCIVGAMVGFGFIYGGADAVCWSSLSHVASSWVLSPVLGATVAYSIYTAIQKFVYEADSPAHAASSAAPYLVGLGVSAFSLSSLYTGDAAFLPAALESLAAGTVAAGVASLFMERQVGSQLKHLSDSLSSLNKRQTSRPAVAAAAGSGAEPKGEQLRTVYSIFGYLQVLSACFMSFAHGSNDVANAIGPIAAALSILSTSAAAATAPDAIGSAADAAAVAGAAAAAAAPTTHILMWGGFGIVAGLLVCGYQVISTIGGKITEITPTRGFAAEFAAASVVVLASRLGLPVSATHTLVGAVMGVGLAQGGSGGVRGEVLAEIAASWAITIPAGAALAVLYSAGLSQIVPAFF